MGAETTLEAEWDGYRTHPSGTPVARTVGPLHTGLVIDPTSADVERCFFIHGVPGAREPMVLVRWAFGERSWEYTRDLHLVIGEGTAGGSGSVEVKARPVSSGDL
jgi:hypothetical protein